MIRIYPSRIEGQPLETHIIGGPIRFDRWLVSAIGQELNAEKELPIVAEINGFAVTDLSVVINPDDDVRIYPNVNGEVALGTIIKWAIVVVVAATAIYTMLNMPKMAKNQGGGQGDDMDMATLRANQPKPNDPIPIMYGTTRRYCDYITMPFKRFENYRNQINYLALCVGVGSYQINPSSGILIGETPISSFGGDVQARIVQPGVSVAGDVRAENWYVCPEVGGTNTASGLDLASTMSPPASPEIVAVLADGKTLTAIGGNDAWPEWQVGLDIVVKLPQTVEITLNTANRNRISGNFSDLVPYVGMPISVDDGTDETDYVITVYEPAIPPVPGVGGSPSMITASSAPTLYDFTAAPATFVITYQSVTTTISLDSDYINMSGLVAYITQELAGTGLVAQDHSGVLRITEPFSPYKGGVITGTALPVDAFGISPTYTTGTASSGGSAGRDAYIELRLPSGGAHVQWLPLGRQRIAVSRRDFLYRVVSIAGDLLTVERLTEASVIDTSWNGWTTRYLDDEEITAKADDPKLQISWLGPFMACPKGEKTRRIEYDIFMPQGIGSVDKKGRNNNYTLSAELQWRDAAIGGAWNTVPWSLRYKSIDQIGVTLALDLPYEMEPEVRMRRTVQAKDDGRHRDQMCWYGLRSRLPAPDRYDGVTTLFMRVRGGDRLSQQSENRVSVRATRIINGVPTRSIKDAVYDVCSRLGVADSYIDKDTIDAISATWWEPRGETYDHQHLSQITAKDAIQGMFAAGMSNITMRDGKLSVRREGVQSMPTQAFTPIQMTTPLQSDFISLTDDDFTGVDVEYMDELTDTAETVQCRLAGVTGYKIEKIRLDGVTNKDRAWRIGMRRLRKHREQRWNYSFETELDAMNAEYLDRISLAEDAVGYSQSAQIIDIYVDIVTLSEQIEWVDNPRVRIRRHDGTATPLYTPVRIDEYTMQIPGLDFVPDTSFEIEPCTLLFGSANKLEYPAMISEIKPNSDGTISVVAVEYSNSFYADDDNNAPA